MWGWGGHISCFSVGSSVTADCVSKSENIGLSWLVILEVSRPRFCSPTSSVSVLLETSHCCDKQNTQQMQFEKGRVCFGYHFGSAVHHGRASIVERMDLAMAAGAEAAGDAAATARKGRGERSSLLLSPVQNPSPLNTAACVQDESSLPS